MNTTSRSEQLQVAGKPCSIDQTLSSFNLPKLRSSKNLERSSSLQVCTKRLGRGAAGTNQRKTVSWGNTDVQQHNGSEVADCFLSCLPVCALPRTRARKLLAANITFYYCFDQPPSSPATNPIKTQPGTQPTNLQHLAAAILAKQPLKAAAVPGGRYKDPAVLATALPGAQLWPGLKKGWAISVAPFTVLNAQYLSECSMEPGSTATVTARGSSPRRLLRAQKRSHAPKLM